MGGGSWIQCPCGDVAQLGEHLLCKQGVVGSIPIVSTMSLSTMSLRLEGGSYRGISEIGEMVCLGRSAPGVSLAVLLLFFVRVNQVLVRLWARVIEAGP